MSCGEFPVKAPLFSFHSLEFWTQRFLYILSASRLVLFLHLLAAFTQQKLRLLDIVHAEQKLYLVFEFLDVDLKRYIETGNQNGKPITAPIVKVSLNSMRFGLSPFLSRMAGSHPRSSFVAFLSRLFIQILSSLHDTTFAFHCTHPGPLFLPEEGMRTLTGYRMPTEPLSQQKAGECMRLLRMAVQFLITSIFVSSNVALVSRDFN